MTTPNIKYKIVPGFPDYLANTDGKIWSLKFREPRLLNGGTDKDGYLVVDFWMDGTPVRRLVHNIYWPSSTWHGGYSLSRQRQTK